MQKKLPPCSSLSDLLSCSNILIVQSKTNPTSLAEQPKMIEREDSLKRPPTYLHTNSSNFQLGNNHFFSWVGMGTRSRYLSKIQERPGGSIKRCEWAGTTSQVRQPSKASKQYDLSSTPFVMSPYQVFQILFLV